MNTRNHFNIEILHCQEAQLPGEKKNVFEIKYVHQWFIFALFISDSQVIPKLHYKYSHTRVFFSVWKWENLCVCSLFLALYLFSWIIFRGNIDDNIFLDIWITFHHFYSNKLY